MIDSPLRRAALAAAAAVSLLSFPAAAQGDAAFAAALGKPLAGLATMAQLKAQPQIPAGNKAPILAASKKSLGIMFWTVTNFGKHTAPTPGSKFGTYAYTADDVKTPTGFDRMSLTLLAAPQAGGGFLVDRLIVEAATVSFGGDTMTAKTWVFLLDHQGRVVLARRGEATAKRDGEMITKPPVKLDLADPAVKARFESILKFWDAY